ncbi:hypothetical protein ACLB2K_035585 [Fragaria x ananassa]
MGDFNITISPEEKLGGSGGVTSYMLEFCDFLNNNGLYSLTASGLPFTWSNKHVDDTIIFECLDRAIGQFAAKAKAWNKTEYGCLFKQMEELNRESAEIQEQLMVHPDSIWLKQKDFQIRTKLLDMWKQEEIFWAQKAKADWLKLGDRNTKFFHTQANIRKKVNNIARMQDESGNWATDEDTIATILVRDVSDEEIQEAINSIGALKALGPNGIHASFYQNCWKEVKDTVIPMIKACFRDVNGRPKCWFQPSRGIRQGDPLSPYIFILAMEPLIRQLDKLARNSKAQVGLLSSPFGFRVSNLMFADDCLIFAKATKKAAGNINTVLNAFAAASGQKINLHKSSLYFSDKVPAGTRNNIVNVINIQQKSSIGKYLGINNVMFWKDPINAKDLMQKLSKRLAGWKQNTLSRAGKLTLIKSNVAGMPNHVMACFKCSKKLTDEIDKQERNFLWGTDMKQAPVAWKDICKLKALGGLGIRPSAFFNNAALAKLAWKIITDKNNWWVQVITQKYLRKCSFFRAKKKQKNSYAWNGILDTRELVLKDGWNITKLREHFTHEVVREIMGIPIPTTPLEDEFIWGPASHGRFTIKSATCWLQLQDKQEHSKIQLIKKLWSLDIQPKIKFFRWLMLRGRLKTQDRLSRFGIVQDNSCPLCNEDNETMDHLFGYCKYAKEIWQASNMMPPLNWEEGFFRVIHEWFVENPFDNVCFTKLITICWQIWKARNEVIFKGKNLNAGNIVRAAAMFQSSTYVASQHSRVGIPNDNDIDKMIRWTPPPPLWVKINFDGSVRSGAAAGDFIIRTDSGNPILAAAFNCGRANVPVTEAMALRNSLIQAQELGVTNVQVEGDSKLVIDVANVLKCSFHSISFSYVLHEANFVANALANLGHSTSTICMWEGCVPPEAAMALSFDIVNVGCSRGTSL